jgi:hypothetical protein
MSEIVEQKWLRPTSRCLCDTENWPAGQGAPLSARHRASRSNLRQLPEVLCNRLPQQALLQVPCADEVLDTRTRHRHSEERSSLQIMGARNVDNRGGDDAQQIAAYR